MKAKEANILSFRVLFDTKGNLVTEVGGLPLEEAHKVFKGTDLKIKTDEKKLKDKTKTKTKIETKPITNNLTSKKTVKKKQVTKKTVAKKTTKSKK